MDRKDTGEFSLEDILQEFGEPAAEPAAVPSDTIRMELPATEPVTGDTIRLDTIQKAVAHAAPDHATEATVRFQAVHIEDEPPSAPVEPFSEKWEPEYDEPMGDYPIPEPIIFRPKSRLRELRQKLVAGPEKRYYALTELGLGKLQLSVWLCFAVFLLSAGAAVLYAWSVVPEQRLRLMVFGQFLGLLLSALLGCYRLIDGGGDLFRLRFSTNTLLVFSFIVCCLDSVLSLQQLRISICSVFSLEMAMALWASLCRRSTEIGQMDTLRRATNLDAVVCEPDYYEGRPGYRMERGEVEHFMEHYQQTPTPERVLDRYALVVLIAGLVIGIAAGVLHGFSVGVQLCAGALLVGMPATAAISVVRPMAVLEKRLHRLGTVLCGWQGVKAVRRRSVFPLNDADLFPAGAAKLNGVKFYGDREPDEVVAYATALIKGNGGALVSLFSQLLDSRNGEYHPVAHMQHYDGGIGGEIYGESVLVGTMEFMQDMGVEMGKGLRVSQAVYCAIDGELCGVFAVAYSKAKSSAAGLRTLCGCGGLSPVVICRDFMLTESFVRSKFGLNTRRMVFPGRELRQELEEKEASENAVVVALTTKEGLAPEAFAVTGARALKSALYTGVVIHMVGGILGLLIMAALAYTGPRELLSTANLLLYELLWMIPGFLVTEWTRTL